MTIERSELHTERLLLRPFRLDDTGGVLAYASDEEWSRYLPPRIPYPYRRADAEEFVAGRVLEDWSENPTFAIVLDGRVVGGINLRVHAADRIGDLGYSIAREQWGRGLMTEAVEVVIDCAFRTFDLAKVVAGADERNVGSWRVMEKVGMKREGVLRSQRVTRDGSRADEVRYGLLRDEWDAK